MLFDLSSPFSLRLVAQLAIDREIRPLLVKLGAAYTMARGYEVMYSARNR